MDWLEKTGDEKTSTNGDSTQSVYEARYRRLFETAQDGILIIDAENGYIIDVNPFLVDLLGYDRNDFLDAAPWRFGPLKDVLANKSAYQELLSKGYMRYDDLPLETKDGRRIEVEFIGNVYQVGQKRTIQCNIRDNSQRKQDENKQLQMESRRRQAQKMAAVASLAGGIAHQFNNALTVISGHLDLLELDGSYQPVDEHVQSMRAAADRLTRLTRQLLAFARGGKYSTEDLFLSDLVRDSLPLVELFLKPQITIETDLPSKLPPILADRDQIQMVMLAVLANASEAIESQGRIRIVCRKERMSDERVTSFSGLSPGTYVSLTISDNGMGMEEGTRCRVFEPFFTTNFPGRGLGMAAAYGIVKNHDGWISIDSQTDRGTMVRVYLPAADPTIDRSLSNDQ